MKLKRLFQGLGLFAVYALFLYCCWLMLEITAQYLPIDSDVAFLRIKQDYIGLPHYLPAFFVHVFTSSLVLPAAFTQFLPVFRVRFPKVHRMGGWIYTVVVLAFAGPSGFLIGLHANGGWPSQIAFCLLGVLWVIFTAAAVWKTRKRDWIGHRDFMIRSFALALSAITLRGWKWLLVLLFQPRPMDVYQIVAWLGWVLNLVIAELIILGLHRNTKKPYGKIALKKPES